MRTNTLELKQIIALIALPFILAAAAFFTSYTFNDFITGEEPISYNNYMLSLYIPPALGFIIGLAGSLGYYYTRENS